MTRTGRPLGVFGQAVVDRLARSPVESTRALAHELQLSLRDARVTVSRLRGAGYVRDVLVLQPDGTKKPAIAAAAHVAHPFITVLD